MLVTTGILKRLCRVRRDEGRGAGDVRAAMGGRDAGSEQGRGEVARAGRDRRAGEQARFAAAASAVTDADNLLGRPDLRQKSCARPRAARPGSELQALARASNR